MTDLKEENHQDWLTHEGGCHCGLVRFRISTAARVAVQRCNCSICRRTGFHHLIVPGRRFELLQGKDALTDYRFNTRTAHHLFCRCCGIKSFYVPRSNPDGYSVNFHCIDQPRFEHVQWEDFDGENWEAHAHRLSHLSQG